MGFRRGVSVGWALALLACHGRETDEVLASLRADNQALREEVAALRAENAALVEAGAPEWRATVSLKRVGGINGRMLYQRTCPLGQALKGFSAKYGSVIDSLLPVCVPVAPVAGSRGPRTLERDLAVIGGRGGRMSDAVCPGDAHMIGVRGRSADVVDALEPVCSGGQNGLRVGGQGGREYERMCPVGWVAVGLSGRHGDYVESLNLTCADPKAAGFEVPPPPPPPSGGEIRRPPPDATMPTEPDKLPDQPFGPPAEAPGQPIAPSVEAPGQPIAPSVEAPPDTPPGRDIAP